MRDRWRSLAIGMAIRQLLSSYLSNRANDGSSRLRSGFTLVPFSTVSQFTFCTLTQMKKHLALAVAISTFMLIGGALTAQALMTSQIESRIKSELPKASGVRASIPLVDIPQNLSSNTIKLVNINIDGFALEGSDAKSSITISANDIGKAQPTIVGSLDVTATIPAATIIKSANFDDAQIVGSALQISVGAGGLGQAQLVPKFSNNTIYFQLQSLSFLGNEVPSSSLPADIQDQIKSKSMRELTVPKGMKLKAVSLGSNGLSVNLRGSNIQLSKLGSLL